MSNVPTLSIIIPAYNIAPFIRAAVESALNQTYRDLEVIVVNDGSTDNTRDVLSSLQNEFNDVRLRIVDKPNGGLASARNAGLREARGRYIGFLDGDDIWCPDKAQKQLEAMEDDPSIAMTFTNSQYMTEQGELTGRYMSSDKAELFVSDMVKRNYVGNGSTPIIRRDCIDIAGFFCNELEYCEDHEMWCRVLYTTKGRALLVPEPLTLYRQRSNSLSHSFERYLSAVDVAMKLFRQTMPNLPWHVFRVAHAEHYRIAAMKSLTMGKRAEATRRMVQTVSICPWLLVTNRRAIGTAIAIAMPSGLRQQLNRLLFKPKIKQTKHILPALLAVCILLQTGAAFADGLIPEPVPFSTESPWNAQIPLSATYAVTEPQLNKVDVELSVWNDPDDHSLPVYNAAESDPLQPVLYNSLAWTSVFNGEWKRSGNDSAVEADILATSKPAFPYAGNPHSSLSTTSWVLPAHFNKLANPPDPPIRVRLPDDAVPAAGSDGYIAVFQDNDQVFEAICGIRLSTGELVAFKYQITSARGDGSGHSNGTTASMIPVYAGLIRESELASGVINHAMKVFAAPNLLKPKAIFPALTFDRGAMREDPPYSGQLPIGARFAIPRSVDLATLVLQSPIGRTIARAAQQYGFIITDRGGGMGISIGVEKGSVLGAWDNELVHDLRAIFNVVQTVQ